MTPTITTVKAPLSGVFAFSFLNRWFTISCLIILIVILPIAIIFATWATPEIEILNHLITFVLPELLSNTFWLILGVGIGVSLLGVSLAWLTTMCTFPGRAFFSWALLMPLAIPAYVLAFVMIGLLDFSGPVQTLLHHTFHDLKIPSIRSRGGVILVMTLALYPYVYLITRNAFSTQGHAALEAAQSLGLTRWQGFFRIALPMARPWIAAGVMLALMETLSDFGTVATFNYNTFTTAIYQAWFSLFSLPAASQLASILIIFVLVFSLTEQRSRAHIKYYSVGRTTAHRYIQLTTGQQILATIFASTIFLIAFVIPVIQLLLWAKNTIAIDLDTRYWEFLWHSLLLASLGALLVTACALLLSYAGRQHPRPSIFLMQRLATMGYSFPGTVLAVGIFIPIAWIDQQIIAFFPSLGQGHAILKGTLATMLIAYLIRFLAVGFSTIDSSLQRISKNIDEAAKTMGCHSRALLTRLHFPLLKTSLITAFALCFVDIIKEMPITLMTRPFGWDTLAVRIFEMTSEGEWERAALPAIAIVTASLIPIILLISRQEK